MFPPTLLISRARSGLTLLVILYALAAPSIAHAQGAFEPGIEGQIWKQLPYVGVPSCPEFDADGNCLGVFDGVSLGKYFLPKAIATDVLASDIPGHAFCDAPTNAVPNANPRIISYVTDQYNNRVQAFDYCGNPVPFAGTPNGDIQGLSLPESIDVDAAHQIIVADRNASRLMIYAPDGTPVGQIQLPAGSLPTGVAVFPNTTIGSSGHIAALLSAPGQSALRIYDALGTLIAVNPQPESCADANNPAAPGALCGPSGVTVDPNGVIYVADYANSRINAYTADLAAGTIAYQFTFGLPNGRPIGSSPGAQPYLQLPFNLVSVNVTMADHSTQQRLIVSDQYNQRLAVYSIVYPGAQAGDFSNPTIDFLFFLDARGDLDGFPSAVAEDALGRIYAIDTGNNRIQRFELPELALVDIKTSPTGVLAFATTFAVTAGVAIPLQKDGLSNIAATICAATDPHAACDPAQPPSSNVTYVDGPTPASFANLGSGQVGYFTWHYQVAGGGHATFTLGATAGPNGEVPADPSKTITVTLGCSNCESFPPSTTAVVTAPGAVPPFYSAPATVSLTAVDNVDPSHPSDTPSGIEEIRIHFTGAQGASVLNPTDWPPCDQQFDPVFVEYCATSAALQSPFAAPSFEISADGSTTVLYRAVDGVGNLEAMQSLSMTVDTTAPNATFTEVPPANAFGWHDKNAASVTATYTLTDGNGSGVNTTVSPLTGSMTFSNEGIGDWTFEAADNVGNAGPVSFQVKIDRTDPTISAPPVTVELTDVNATPATVTVTANDALSGLREVTGPQFGTYAFTTGHAQTPHQVSFTAFDYAGNSATASTTVTVVDTTPPVLSGVPGPFSLQTDASGTAQLPDFVGLGQITATDLNPPVAIARAITRVGGGAVPGPALGPGTYTVKYTATDGAGNATSASTTVTVQGTTPPTTTASVTAPGSFNSFYRTPTVHLVATDPSAQIRVRLTGAQAGPVPGLPLCAGLIDGIVGEYCGPATTAFTLTADGATTVLFRAVNNAGNAEAVKSLVVTVDAVAPAITFTPATLPNGAGWYNSASVTVNHAATDGGSGIATVVPAGGAQTIVAEGTTTVSVTGTDNVGNSATASFTVKIDRTPSVITAPAPVVAELVTVAGTPVALAPATATDALSGGVVLTDNAPAAGLYPFSAGPTTVCNANQCATTVTFTATDAAGNVATKTTTVTVRDTTGPAITLPAPPSLLTGQLLPDLTPQVVAVDLSGGAVTITQSPAAGTTLTLGANTVTFTAKDQFGNASTKPLTFIVGDGTPPTISCTPVTLAADPVTHLATVGDLRSHATASDNSGTVTVTQQSPDGNALPAGVHPLIFTATDPSNNTASCTTTITVTGVPKPTATLTVSPGVLWPPNHKLVKVTATIALGADPNATVKLISITSSEADNGLGDGDTANDIQTINGRPISTVYGTDVRSFQLRAERSGRGPGRTYTITYQVSNASGSITVTARVLVPHDMGGNGHFDGDGCHGGKHDGKPGDQDRDDDKDKKGKNDDRKGDDRDRR